VVLTSQSSLDAFLIQYSIERLRIFSTERTKKERVKSRYRVLGELVLAEQDNRTIQLSGSEIYPPFIAVLDL